MLTKTIKIIFINRNNTEIKLMLVEKQTLNKIRNVQ